jgi:hypothetical protein
LANPLHAYRLRLLRKRWLWRARIKARALRPVSDRTARIGDKDILIFATVRNERVRLPYFLDYYRALGVGHFLIVDNASDDETGPYLRIQPDVSLWHTTASYRQARYGVDWLNALRARFAHGHWTLAVDPDELLVYPHCDTRPLRALTDWLDDRGVRAMSAMLLDMYPKGPVEGERYREGQDPLEIACWFDAGNYRVARNPDFGNLWIQGGVRDRVFFAEDPARAPALNKIPLVRWHRRYVYASSAHMLLPRGLNRVSDPDGAHVTGVLMHPKFLDGITRKVREEATRREHYGGSVEYRAYAQHLSEHSDLWCPWSERYLNWRQLDWLGLMSRGHWA